MTHYVLDACALIALFKEEEGFETVRDLITAADNGSAAVSMSTINALEVYYGFITADGIDYATGLMRRLDNSSVQIVDHITRPVFDHAARLKGIHHRLSLADAVGLATAAGLNACFVTSDHKELEPIGKAESLDIFWFR
jgi:PIN domain nuclease of toxin-antitoxin system